MVCGGREGSKSGASRLSDRTHPTRKAQDDFRSQYRRWRLHVVINAEQIAVTGNRLTDKQYRRHSGYVGGMTSIRMKDMMGKHPERAIEIAVKGMLPKNALGREMFKKLKVYAGGTHPHAAQKPKALVLPESKREE